MELPTHNTSLADARIEKRKAENEEERGIMSKLIIQHNKTNNLTQLDFTHTRVICEQSNADGTSIKLNLVRRLHNNKHSILLSGIAYENGKLIKNSNLGDYPPTDNGSKMIISACECYTYSGMYELITA